MKKVFTLFAISFVSIGLCLYSCTKDENENSTQSQVTPEPDPDPDPDPDPNSDTLVVNVSQTPTTRSILIEEFTGNRCGYCPLGHKAANEVVAAYPGKAFVINYHVAGGLAVAYTTQAGNVLNSAYNVANGSYSIPAALINRHDFNNGSAKLTESYGNYGTDAAQIAAMPACANVAAAARIDRTTRTLELKVKVYYTDNGTGSNNKLHVALIQNNVMGTQSGSSGNPDQVVGNQYKHNEMFLKFITRFSYSSMTNTYTEGENISPVSQGSLIERTYTYTIPESFTDPTNNTTEAVVLDDLEIVVFVTQTNEEVINACKANLTIR